MQDDTAAPSQPGAESLARAIWALEIEDALQRDGQSGVPAYTTYADRTDVEEPCEFEEQSAELREWCRWRATRLLRLAAIEDASDRIESAPSQEQGAEPGSAE